MTENERLLDGIEAIEQEVASTILEQHSYEFEVVSAALEQILRGINEFADQKQELDDTLERAQLFLTVRSFNSLRVAMTVLENGYTQQALTLIRTVMEDQLVVKDIENHPPTLDALFEDAEHMGRREFRFQTMADRLPPEAKKAWDMGRREFRFQTMADRLPPEAKKAWDKKYGFASSFAAHPRPLSMQKLIEFEMDGKKSVRTGGRYERPAVIAVLFFAILEIPDVLSTLGGLTSCLGSDWENSALSVRKKVEIACRNLANAAKKELGESATTVGSPGDLGGG